MNTIPSQPGSSSSRNGMISGKKQTCVQCRNRKVRCDGVHDVCGNCSRLGFECSFSLVQSEGVHPVPKRKRVSRACVSCHAMKSRCSGHSPQCERCAAKGIACEYIQSDTRDPQRRTGPLELEAPGYMSDTFSPLDSERANSYENAASPADFNSSARSDGPLLPSFTLLSPDRISRAIQNYFDYLQALPSLAFLHRMSLLRLYNTGGADQALLASIIAVSSRLPDSSASDKEIGSRCADLAETAIMKELKSPSISKIQALVLLIRYKIWTGSLNDAYLLMAPLVRSAFALHLNYEISKRSFFIQESRRRLMWAIYVLDSAMAGGVKEHILCPVDAIHLRLPFAEDDFELDKENKSERMEDHESPPENVTMIAFYLRVIKLHDDIMKHVKGGVNSRTDFNALQNTSQYLERQLHAFNSHLPLNEQRSQKNLELWAFTPRFSRYMMTHVWWHQCHCRLFRRMIPGLHEDFSEAYFAYLGSSVALDNQAKALHHAHMIATTLDLSLSIKGSRWILDYEMAECAYGAAEILLVSEATVRDHLGLTLEQVMQGAIACLRLLEKMSHMYNTISALYADLERGMQFFRQGQPFKQRAASTSHTPPGQRLPGSGLLGMVEFPDDSHKLEIAFPLDLLEKSQPDNLMTPTSNIISPSRDHMALIAEHGQNQNIPGMVSSEEPLPFWDPVPDTWDPTSIFQWSFNGLEPGSGDVL